jgi:hypothetical protein
MATAEKQKAYRTVREKRKTLERAALYLSQIDANNFSEYRSQVYDLGFQLEQLESLRAQEKQRLRREEKPPSATLGSTLRQPYLVR